MEKIVIVDYGSQYTQLIARRLRDMHVFSEIVSPKSLDKLPHETVKGLILSGGPGSTARGAPKLPETIAQSKIPILGICYGMQLLNVLSGGEVSSSDRREYGRQEITFTSDHPLFHGLNDRELVWMSHGDSVSKLASSFQISGKSRDGTIAAISHCSAPHYGVQFHPEVTHTPNGKQILHNFLTLCDCERKWSPAQALALIKDEIRNRVGDKNVISLVSGGVDSTVATLICTEALGPDQVIPIHIDSGLMRENESEEVVSLLKDYGMTKLDLIDAKETFLNALKGVTDPEQKRQIIGDLFIEILDDEMEKLMIDDKTFLCQGTLYTDLIESGKGCGEQAALIKSHHNVNSPFVDKKRRQGLIIEPNALIFKDEVRQVGVELGVPPHLVWRHPFPGPGLAIRICGEVTEERLATLRKADTIFIEEIKAANLYQDIWQAFTVLIPVSTVGVMGDQRSEGHVIALRAVSSVDGMTADFSDLSYDLLSKVSTRIINEVSTINRVVYDVSSKPPSTIEWE